MAQKYVETPSRPRGRPRKFDEAEVLAASRDVFWDHGYAATSLTDIATATGLARPSLQAAFGDKHALYARTLRDYISWTTDGMRQRLAEKAVLREALDELFSEVVAGTLAGDRGARGCFVVCTAVTEALRDSETKKASAEFFAGLDQVFRERFERSASELNAGLDPGMAAVLATAMLQTIAVRARSGTDPASLADVSRAAVIAICGDDI